MTKLPDALERRELLYGKQRKTPDFEGLGRAYLEADQPSEALEFFLKLEDPSQRDALVREIRDVALEAGNWFVLNRIHGVSGIDDAQWKRAQDNAQKAGKLHYALKCAKQLGDTETVTQLELELGLRPPEPEPSQVGTVEGGQAEAKADDAE